MNFLQLNSLKTKKYTSVKFSGGIIYVEKILHLLLHSLPDYTFSYKYQGEKYKSTSYKENNIFWSSSQQVIT